MMKKLFLISTVLLLVGATDDLLAQSPSLPNPLVTGQAASIVVGQRNFSDITFGNTPDRWGAVSGMAVAGNRLIVADSSYLAPPNNNRVLIYNNLALIKQRLPQGNLPNADIVLGQARPDTNTPGTSATLMNQPVGVATDGTRLFISEWGNNRILIYNRIPTEEGVSADVVIGQANFTTATFAAGANRLRRPNSVASDGRRVFIADTLNNRVLIYNSIPTQNGANADVVLGQANFDNFGRSPAAANRMYDPMSVTTDGTRLIVTDFGNNRVLIYNSIPTQSGASADVVVGQSNFTGTEPGNTASTLNFPRYAFSDGTRLLIVDSGNNRVLIYNRIPTANGAVADLVIGQQDFTGLFESCAASYFAVPYAAGTDGDTLFVADSFNRRVLGFRPGAPMISSVVNAASFSPRAQTAACSVILPQPPLAPGGLAAVMGVNLADARIGSTDLPMAYELGGVSVKVNGIPAPVYFVSPEQVNIQIPFEVTGYSASIEVTRRTGNTSITSAAAPLGLANGAPGIFTRENTGPEGPGIILHADQTPVTEASPAVKGEILIANVTGLGTVDHPVVNGVAAQFGAEGTITVGGVVAEGQTVTVTINGRTYSYTARKDDTLASVNAGLTALINDNDPDVKATANEAEGGIALRAIVYGDQGTNITYSASGTDGSSLNATTAGSLVLPASFTFSGTPVPGQTLLFTFAQTSYTYTVAAGDTAADVLRKIAADIDSDPNIAVGVDLANLSMRLVLEDENLNIPFRASLSDAGTSIVIITGNFSFVPGSLTFAGPVTPGQTVTIVMQNTQYPYTTVAGDTLETLVTRLAALVNADTNVSATADTANKSISFALKTPNLNISFSAFVRLANAFQADTGGVGVAPATLALRGNPSAGQTVRAFVGTRIYSYTVVAGDTLGTIATRLAGLINFDLKVSATADAAAGTISIALREEPKLLVPGTITFSGTLTSGHVLTVQLAGVPYTYTVVAADTLQTLVTKFAQAINADPNVSAVADTITNRILLSRRNPTLTDEIPFRLILPSGSSLTTVTTSADQTPVSISIGGTQSFQLLTEGNRLTAGDALATNTVSATIGEALNVVPGIILFGGTLVPGEVLTVRLLDTLYQYTVAASDTVQSMVTNFAQVISTDPNVSATADTVNNRINLALKDAASTAQITFRIIVPTTSTLLAATDSTTTTGSTGTSVSFAGLLKGSVGVYQVYFTVPANAAPNPVTKFSLQQNLIILGSVSEFDIFSNIVTFPVGE